MLLEFRVKNYKTFKDELVFSMIPAPKQKGLDYSILHEKIGNKSYKALSSAVIYGPNAAGKTNIIEAMDTFKSIVLRGHIRNTTKLSSLNIASTTLELIPNNTLTDSEPVCFSIKFIDKEILFEYSFSMDLGTFLEKDFKRKIIKETLKANEKALFERGEKLDIPPLDFMENYLVSEFKQNEKSIKSVAENSLNDEELFLINGFKNMFSPKIVKIISDWLDNSFLVVHSAHSVRTAPTKLSNPNNDLVHIDKTLNEAAKLFGVDSNQIVYIHAKEDEPFELCSIFEKRKGGPALIPSEIFESHGTIRFLNMFPLIKAAISKGKTLVIDEFDASIHPIALMNIVNIFHNNEINKNNAQLIFNTHNPIFLNANLFRRDEIKFVERDETNCSTHYSLSDFGTAGKAGVRKNEDYMKNYFIDRYGATKDVDFTPLFENLLQDREEIQE